MDVASIREFALGLEALERFVHQEPLRRVHECVFGVLALEHSSWSTAQPSISLCLRQNSHERTRIYRRFTGDSARKKYHCRQSVRSIRFMRRLRNPYPAKISRAAIILNRCDIDCDMLVIVADRLIEHR
jgi:hypothetical protein